MATKKSSPKYNIKDFDLLYDNVLIQALEITEHDGIYKPAQYDSKPELGIVVRVGNGRINEDGSLTPLIVKPNDVVYFNKYSHTKFNFDGTDSYIIREEDIVGYIRGSIKK